MKSLSSKWMIAPALALVAVVTTRSPPPSSLTSHVTDMAFSIGAAGR